MPELPEVETIKRVLEPQIKGLSIQKVIAVRPEVIGHPTGAEFCSRLTQQSVSGMARRGKFLIVLLDGGDRLIIHLRMTGCLLLTPADYPQEKHTHVIIEMNDGSQLRFSDTRRFGRIWLLGDDETDTYSGVEKLGKEPFDTDFSAEYLSACLGKRKKTIKECLMEQRVIAGIGNIYSDEILFAAGIYPARPANHLSGQEWTRLAEVIPRKLSFFIEKNSLTPEEYLESKGQNYRNTPFLQVYGKEGQSCPICGAALCRMVIGGRSSTFCPHCQKEME
ncbi:MAG: bifunctional DNA-formamidopyrimidine glycosylase/DNA-(apurinic or apyrimidinic site) lyase [Lachnospiraceae bacterium]